MKGKFGVIYFFRAFMMFPMDFRVIANCRPTGGRANKRFSDYLRFSDLSCVLVFTKPFLVLRIMVDHRFMTTLFR